MREIWGPKTKPHFRCVRLNIRKIKLIEAFSIFNILSIATRRSNM